jgi:hypothetical protein
MPMRKEAWEMELVARQMRWAWWRTVTRQMVAAFRTAAGRAAQDASTQPRSENSAAEPSARPHTPRPTRA